MPHICRPLYVCTPPVHSCDPRGVQTPHMPPYPVHLCVFGGFACCGGCNGLPFVLGHLLTPPLFGGASPSITPPHSVVGSLCFSTFQGYQYVMRAFPSVEGFGGVPLSIWGVWGYQHLRCPYAHSCTFFVVDYASYFDYGSDYYSSSYSGIFWPVISIISHSGSFP